MDQDLSLSELNIADAPSGFIPKVYHILENPKLAHIVTWNPKNDGFIIHDSNRLEKEVLPVYFKHNKLGSFVRQLNMYDFHKMRTKDDTKEFKHEYLRRGRPEFLKYIRRKGHEDIQTQLNCNPKPEPGPCEHAQSNCALKTPTNLLNRIKELEESCKTFESLARLSVPIKKLKVLATDESVLLFNGLISYLEEGSPNGNTPQPSGVQMQRELIAKVTREYVEKLRAIKEGTYSPASMQDSRGGSNSPIDPTHKVKHLTSANTSMADEDEHDFTLGKRRRDDDYLNFTTVPKVVQLGEDYDEDSLESKDFGMDLLDFRHEETNSHNGSLDQPTNTYRSIF